MDNLKAVGALLLLALTTSCARVVVTPFATDNHTMKGVRYYAPQLYLLVTYQIPDAALVPQHSSDNTAVVKEVPGSTFGRFKVADKTTTTTTKTNALTVEVQPVATYKFMYLPDYDRGYLVTQKGFLGSSELSLKLTDGWQLADFGAKSDSQIPATIEAATALLGIAAAFKAGEAPKAGLYKVDLKTGAFTLVGGFPAH